jgi:hypothetical protein
MFDSRNFFSRSEANMFILKNLNIEAKRTGSIVILYFKKRKKTNSRFFLKRRAKNERVRKQTIEVLPLLDMTLSYLAKVLV